MIDLSKKGLCRPKKAVPGCSWSTTLLISLSLLQLFDKEKELAGCKGNVGPIGQQHIFVINLRFHFSEGSEALLVVKSRICVRMEQEAWWLQQKNVMAITNRRGGYNKKKCFS